ncbi:transporter [Saprospiraceae bacterium]|nr:transporter [Saprospiraceae bacterium]
MLIIFGSSCVAPVNSSYESAKTLGKGNMEAMGHYTRYTASLDGETEKSNENYGLRVGYGANDKFDVSMQYILMNAAQDEEGPSTVNYLALAFKYSLLKNKIAASLPVGTYFYDSESTFFISPKLLFTYPVNEKFETTFASKIDFYLEEDSEANLGFNLGFGISKNLSQWAIRPEAGYLFNPGDEGGYWSFGVGFNYYFPVKNGSNNN